MEKASKNLILKSDYGSIDNAIERLQGKLPRQEWNQFERSKPGGLFTRNYSNPQLISGVKIPSAWRQYNSQDPNGFNLGHAQLWFTRTFTSASTRSLNFFDLPLATPDLFTNVFPYPQSVLVKAIGVYFKINPSLTTGGVAPANQWASRLDDVIQIINTGVLTITLSKRSWGPFALWKLASGAGAWGLMTGGSTPGIVNYANIGMPTIEAAFRLIIPFVIPANSTANWTITWPTTITLNNGNPDLCLCLETVEAGPIT